MKYSDIVADNCVIPRILVNPSGYVIESYVRIFARMARYLKFTFLAAYELRHYYKLD